MLKMRNIFVCVLGFLVLQVYSAKFNDLELIEVLRNRYRPQAYDAIDNFIKNITMSKEVIVHELFDNATSLIRTRVLEQEEHILTEIDTALTRNGKKKINEKCVQNVRKSIDEMDFSKNMVQSCLDQMDISITASIGPFLREAFAVATNLTQSADSILDKITREPADKWDFHYAIATREVLVEVEKHLKSSQQFFENLHKTAQETKDSLGRCVDGILQKDYTSSAKNHVNKLANCFS